MKGKGLIYMAIVLVVFSACKHKQAASSEAPKPMNIVYILADDLSFRDLSCYGQKQFETPNIDALAASGALFTQAYAAASECAPSRASLLTGLHGGHAPIRDNSSARGQEYMPDEFITVAELLKQANYKTGFVGKWGLGLPGTEGVPERQGFDYSFGFYDQGRAHTYYPLYLMENGQRIEYPANKGFDMKRRYVMNSSKEDKLLNEYSEDGRIILSELAEPQKAVYSQAEVDKAAFKFLKTCEGQAFFLYYATQLPHGPLIIDDLGDMNDNTALPQRQREWAAMVMRLDAFVGDLVAYLKASGEYDNTMIFFSSDNGYSMCGYMGRGNRSNNWPDDPYLKNKGPFEGGKFSVLEGGLRVPLIISCPRLFSQREIKTPVCLTDFYATAADIADVEIAYPVDGKSLLPLLNGASDADFYNRPMYFFKNTEQAVRLGPWKAYRPNMASPIELYDVEEDTYCQNDLSEAMPEIVKQVEKVMETAHSPHMWYRDPWESDTDFKFKVEAARASGTMQVGVRPNGL